MPYQLDWQLRVPYPANPDGWYYWTNAWILNANNDASAITRANQVGNWVIANTTADCQRVRRTFKRAPGRDGVYFNQYLFDLPGTRPADPLGYNLLWHVRIDWLRNGRVIGYKRWRLPLGYSDVTDGQINPALIASMAAGLDPLMGLGTLSSLSGEIVSDYRIHPEPRMWQLRHGTERRERVVIA